VEQSTDKPANSPAALADTTAEPRGNQPAVRRKPKEHHY